jgi:hypothetical protein
LEVSGRCVAGHVEWDEGLAVFSEINVGSLLGGLTGEGLGVEPLGKSWSRRA